ncbi:DNA mismatch repair protein MutL [Pseudovibrio sp. Ad5]|uniref:ATP-binding protein n=1 Tax=Pseudovibrio sp. Ad5 TaxID=989436 RepID=UPI0007AE8195|nr:ATP-binding protein [Pseudovibrio sp. Ad5]KZK96430.1 DNA mismatch repair protein MutL [Pseudovibrio sp. Ad5]
MSEQVYFKTSAGVKDIVGRDLITNDFVAVFELVKNSFDALASRVDVVIEDEVIYIVDNGKGMTRDELLGKWLFLGYSAKQDGQEAKAIRNLDSIPEDFRSRIDKNRSAFAGNKGIGRFSCDRLGCHLELFTKSASTDNNELLLLSVDWRDFEDKLSRRIENVPLNLDICEPNELPLIDNVPFEYGTIAKITGVRSEWDRSKILKLKTSLAKLVNPFGSHSELNIFLHSKKELSQDEKSIAAAETTEFISEMSIAEFGESNFQESQIPRENNEVVNGEVRNLVLDRISRHTTNIQVTLEDKGRLIRSKIFDRNELIVEYIEVNKYEKLFGLDAYIEIHFLNKAARNVFTRYMGQPSTQFGHIFLLNDGFRVYPVGEPTDDTFGLNQRKTQGYSRFLGTREIIGQINIKNGKKEDFREASSRDAGLVRTPAYTQLEDLFSQKCLRPLERYVTGVLWVDKEDNDRLDLSGMQSDNARARIISTVANITKSKDINIERYSENFLKIIDDNSQSFSDAMDALEKVAAKLDNKALSKELAVANKKHREIERKRREAVAEAEAHRKARRLAEKEAKQEKEKREFAEKSAIEAQKRVNFFTALDTNDFDSLVAYHHHVGTYSSEVTKHVILARNKIKRNIFKEHDIEDFIESVELANSKIQSIVNFATKANFILDGEETKADLSQFMPQYINKICSVFSGSGLEFETINYADEFVKEFKPIELFVIIDNLVHNASKAGASKLTFKLTTPSDKLLLVEVTDNGSGLDTFVRDINTIFEKGYTTTTGSGLGLFHARDLMENELNGRIDAVMGDGRAIKFRLEFTR